MFSLEADFDLSSLKALINGEVENWFDDLADYFRARGRELVNKARAKTSAEQGFNNITWNLRASIGMCIVFNGKIIETYFPPISKGAHGNMVGRELAERLAIYSQGTQGVNMVFVAGEEYAHFVQVKGKDVIGHVIGDNLEDALRGIM